MVRPRKNTPLELSEAPLPQTPDVPLALRRTPRSTRNRCPVYTPITSHWKKRIIPEDQATGSTSTLTSNLRKSRIPAMAIHEIPSLGNLEPRSKNSAKDKAELDGLASGLGAIELDNGKKKKTAGQKKGKAKDPALDNFESTKPAPDNTATFEGPIKRVTRKASQLLQQKLESSNDEEDSEETPQIAKKTSLHRKPVMTKPVVQIKHPVDELPGVPELPETSSDEEEFFSTVPDNLSIKKRDVTLEFLKKKWSTRKPLWGIEAADIEELQKEIEVLQERNEPVDLLEGMLEVVERFEDFRDAFDDYLEQAAECGLKLSRSGSKVTVKNN
ncbi:hypothetical protein P154DRAFT_203511 [Amniculicola lignicola CBS 123094]|uniref:Uncharacterized protein n=1 Tax=Amniculicola lignicola CBS 123094 TaxID=1392246 RepID=A0A6A5WRD4_9PLEO|nr:hypothetical protein P154DRAFT_203511 [Amniculicola lignicola CBS 123094]